MVDVVDPAQRLKDLLNRAEPNIARVFGRAARRIAGNLDLAALEKLLSEGKLEQALKLVEGVAEELAGASSIWFIRAGQDTVKFLDNAGIGSIVFDQVNVRAVQQLRSNNLRLITEFTSEQRRATKLALLDGVKRGLNPRDQARAFRASVGLAESQVQHVINYRRLVERAGDVDFTPAKQRESLTRALRDGRSDPSIERAIRNKKKLTKAQVDNMVDRYSKRYIAHRAVVIARTESLRAVHEGANEAYEQAFDRGVIKPTDLERNWDASGDGRVRDTHGSLDGQKKKWGEVWSTVNGKLRYPGDPLAPALETIQCRCVLTTRIKK